MTNNVIQSSQVALASGNSLEAELALKLSVASFIGSIGNGAKSLTLPNGDIIKSGTLGASVNIASNGNLSVTVTFATPFPTACVFFDAKMTPNTTVDFYGMTSVISMTSTQVTFNVHNGATLQAIASGQWLAVGY
jgi:hypothetical protein